MQFAGTGTVPIFLSAPISSLSTNTTYHFALACVNNAGAFGFGSDRTFTTLSSSAHSHAKIGTNKATVSKHGVVKFLVICNSTLTCKGTLTLKSLKGKKLANAVHYTIAGGHKKMVKMKLTKKALNQLKSAKNHKLKAKVRTADNDGGSASKVVTLKLA